jgi:PiT family inorganic phosphate transporter
MLSVIALHGDITLILILVVVISLVFDFINGFHDTANAVATVIATRVLTPQLAILMSGTLNFCGAMIATHVASTISKGIINPDLATQPLVLAAVVGAIVWNLITWFFGIPSSSSHALIGGLVGAGIAHGGMQLVLWKGVWQKVAIPLLVSPIAGFILGLIVMTIITTFFANSNPKSVGTPFKRLQLLSSAAVSLSHGQNDGQKSMGIITLALITNHFLPSKADPPLWVMICCALAMGLGTSAGGYRIIHTMGHRIFRLEPVQGFAAEATAATVILTASNLGAPVSTTHVVAGSVFGVGASRRLSAVRWQVALNMVVAWVITLPASAAVAALTYYVLRIFGI